MCNIVVFIENESGIEIIKVWEGGKITNQLTFVIQAGGNLSTLKHSIYSKQSYIVHIKPFTGGRSHAKYTRIHKL